MGMMTSVSVIFVNVETYSCSSNKIYCVDIEYKIYPINIKGIDKFLDIYGFSIVEYSVRSESGRIIMIPNQKYYVPRLLEYLFIISPKVILTSEGYKVAFISHCNDDNYRYVEIKLIEYKPVWQKLNPVERVYIRYESNKNLPTHKALIHEQIYKEFKAM